MIVYKNQFLSTIIVLFFVLEMCLNEITRETTVVNGRRKGEPFRRYLIDQSEGGKQRDGGCKASASACEMLDRE